MRDFKVNPTISGSWEEDLDCCINAFEILSAMCELTPEEKLKSVPVILTGNSLNYCSNKIRTCNDFEEDVIMLKNWYNLDDWKARMLSKW